MRILDILTESILTEAKALSKRDFYLRDRLAVLISRLVKRDNFPTVTGDYVKPMASKAEIAELKRLYSSNYDGKGEAIDNSLFPATIGGIKLSQLVKTNDLGGRGGVGATGEEEGQGNLGPTVEALKSMAIFAKIMARGSAHITAKQVLSIAKSCKTKEEIITVDDAGKRKTPTSRATISKQIEDLRQPPQGGIKDKISLTIDVSTASFNRAVNVNETDKKAWGSLTGIINYVNNESDLGKYSRFFAQNAKRDPIHIQVVGIGGAKTDIKTVYDDGKDRGLDDKGMPIERTLGHLNMSIKAGSDMYDQASGNTLEGTYKFFNILGLSSSQADSAIEEVGFIAKPKRKKGDPVEDAAVVKQRIQAVRSIYSIVAREVQEEINQMTDREEGSFISRILNNLTSSIKGKGQLVYVNFDTKGNYHKLNPQQIALLGRSVELGVTVDTTTRTEPHLYIKDTKTGKSIFHVRPAILKSGRITHTFELDHLLDLVKSGIRSAHPAPSDAAAPAAVTSMATPTASPTAVQAPVTAKPAKKLTIAPVKHATPPKRITQPDPEELAGVPQSELRYSGE